MPRLRALREEAKMTQTELAEATGNTTSYISLLESGRRRNPSAIRALAIIRVLSERLGRPLTFDDVFGDDDAAASDAAKTA